LEKGSVFDYAAIFQSLGPRLLVGGDWNAKHTAWVRAYYHAQGLHSFPYLWTQLHPLQHRRSDLLAEGPS
jgi:hypothetical protein